MRLNIIVAALSRLLMIIGLAMLVPIIVSLYYNEPAIIKTLAISSAITLSVSLIIYRLFPLKDFAHIRPREVFAIVTFGWVVVALFGSLPYQLAGILDFTDAIFETMSGFTTAGASIFYDVEVLPKGILIWRSLTHWLGGMGIVVLYIAFLTQIGASALQIFKAESPSGPVAQKVTPKIKDTAKFLWYSYITLSCASVILLWLSGMNLFDSITFGFSAIATAGLAIKNSGLTEYSPLIQGVIIFIMFLGATNFALYYQAFKRRSLKVFWANEEFRLYLFIILVASFLIATSLLLSTDNGISDSIFDSLFQAVSIITTTGFASVDYETWPFLAKAVIFILFFVGGSFGSTSGGMKVGRYLILFKLIIHELKKFAHPKSILTLRVNGKEVSDSVAYNTLLFFFVYISLFAGGILVMCGFGLDLVSSSSAVAASLGVVGPGFGAVGPTQNFAFIHPIAKYFLLFLMLVGRLELFTVLVLLLPDTWRKRG